MLPKHLYTAAQVRDLDQYALRQLAIDSYALMCRAGQSAFATLRTHWPRARRIAVICGPGNNGGDGYVFARLALAVGLDVRVIETANAATLQDAAASARADWLGGGGIAATSLQQAMQDADLIVDALFGTGLQRPITGVLAEMIETINQSNIPVFALDIPSGLHADTGAILGTSINAHRTLSFIGLKPGLFTAQGPARVGQVLWDGLGAPDSVYANLTPHAMRLDHTSLTDYLRPRANNAHKGDFGHVLVIGGCPGMSGAIQLCAEAALRAGAGLVSVATHPAHAALISAVRPEIMSHAIRTLADLDPLIKRANVIAIGPGLGQSAWIAELFQYVIQHTVQPLVIDADGLNLLASQPSYQPRWVLTPHPGEAGRLLNVSTNSVQTDRFKAAEDIVTRYGGVCVLKGSGTIIHAPQGRFLCSAGNPGMASGGMGDVLTGVVAAFIAQGLNLHTAACAAVCTHAVAGDRAAANGMQGLLASDVIAKLRTVCHYAL